MSDFQLRVVAETQDAERKLGDVSKRADEATKSRQINIEIPNYSQVSKNFADLKRDVADAANGIKQLYKVAGQLPGSPVQNINEAASNIRDVAVAAGETKKILGDAGSVIQGSFAVAGKAADSLVGKITRMAFGLYAISEAAKVVQAAFSGLFNETIGREIQLRETILKTQTTLASTNKVFANGKEITDPYTKIVALTGEVSKRIDSIRERSIALAGVTSNDVIEVFGIVASQVGQIGGGLKEAEDLAINFAAALGTFGIPLYQASQEVGSILRGDITMDSYLAKALGITNDDIAKAKTQAGGVVKFLEDRLAAAVAGQRIAAEGFAGVVSNIKDLSELINQNFGRGLLDPLIDGLSKVFNFLFNIRQELFSIASKAGASVGTLLSIGFGRTLGASGGASATQITGRAGPIGSAGARRGYDSSSLTKTQSGFNAADVLQGVEDAIQKVTVEINRALSTIYLQLATITERASAAFGSIVKGLAALAYGLLSLKLEQIKALIGAFEAVSPALLGATRAASGFLAVWGEFLKLPVVQQITQISANMRLLEVTGVMPLIKTGFVLKGVLENWGRISDFVINQFNKLRVIIGGLVAYLGTLSVAVSAAAQRMLAAWQPSSVALQALKAELQQIVVQLNTVGAAAQNVGSKIGSLGMKTKGAGGGVIGLVTGFIKFNLIMLAISATLGLLLERYSSWKEAQDRIASDKRAEEAVRRLETTYKDVGDSADEATKRAKAFEQSLVNAKYDEAVDRLEKVRAKLAEINDLRTGQNLDFGDYVRRLFQLFNPANFDATLDQKPGELFADTVFRKRKEQEEQILADLDRWKKEVNNISAKDNIQLEAQNRVNLEKEIGGIRRQQESELFRLRQSLAQKEVEIFRAAGELRIFQMEQANAKLLEGQEGASRAAIQALNEYLTTRERGELDIEASRQELIIEIQNLEKSIADYRIENELKIAEIRKRAGDYEKKVAQYQVDMARSAAQSGSVTAQGVSDGFRVGSTGRSTGPHLDIRSPTNDKAAVINEALAIIKKWQSDGVGYIVLSNANIDVKNLKDDSALRAALQREQEAHSRRAGGGAIDIAVPAGTLVPMPVGTPSWGGAGGWQATSLTTGNLFLHGLDASTATPGAQGSVAQSTTPVEPTAPNFNDIGTAAADRFAEASRNVGAALGRLNALREALTNAKTLAAFERIAKAAFPRIPLEQYRDEILSLKDNLESLSTVSADAYDPERAKIQIEAATKLGIKQEEINEILKDAKPKLNAEEYLKLEQQLAQEKKQFIEDLATERERRLQILELTQATRAQEELITRTRDKRFETLAGGIDARGAMADSFYGDNPAARRRAAAEMEISRERLRLERERIPIEGETLRRLQEFAAATRASAEVLGQLDEAVVKFERSMELVRGAASTITDGYKGFFKEILTGGDLQEAMNNMLEGMTSKFLDMALDAAFQPFEKMLEEQFKKVFNINDPMQQLQIENNNALAANTAALNANTNAKGTPSTGNSPVPLEVLPYDGSPTPVDILPDRGEPVTVEKLQAQLDQTTQTVATVNTQLPELNKASSNAAQQVQGVAGKAAQAQSGFDGLMKNMGGAMAALGGIAMGIAGAQQMQKGGVYNTLMGLAGIFGGISSVAGGLSSFGGLFGGGGAGVGGSSTGLTASSAAAIDKYSVPLPGNVTMKSFAGGGYTGNGVMSGGLDGRGGFMAMLHPNETVVPGDPFKHTRAAVASRTSTSNRAAVETQQDTDPFLATRAAVGTQQGNSWADTTARALGDALNGPSDPIKLETRVINGIEYATVDQLREATMQAEARGAERGRALTLSSIKNNVKIRRAMGM